MSESESPLEETPKRAKKKVYLQRAHVDRYTTQKKTEEQRQDSTGIESDKPAEFKGDEQETNEELIFSKEISLRNFDDKTELGQQQQWKNNRNGKQSIKNSDVGFESSSGGCDEYAGKTNAIVEKTNANSASELSVHSFDSTVSITNEEFTSEELTQTQDFQHPLGNNYSKEKTKNGWKEDLFTLEEDDDGSQRHTEQLEALLRAKSFEEENDDSEDEDENDDNSKSDDELNETLQEEAAKSSNRSFRRASEESESYLDLASSPPFDPGEDWEGEEREVQFCESETVTPTEVESGGEDMMASRSSRSPTRSSTKKNTPESSSAQIKRSRTVLYFDSDDDEEGKSHIKESVVLEEDDEELETELDAVERVTSPVLPNEVDRELPPRPPTVGKSRTGSAFYTQTKIADLSIQKGEHDEVSDDAEISAYVVLQGEDEDTVTVSDGIQISKELLNQNRPSSVIATGAHRLSLESRKKFAEYVDTHASERSDTSIAGFASSSDEFDRLIPNRKVSLLCCSWNMAEGRFLPENMKDLLFPSDDPQYEMEGSDNRKFYPDIFVVSTQESTPDKNQWAIKLQETVGLNHVLAHMNTEGVLYMCIFVRRDLIWHLSQFENCFVQTRAAKQIKTKGALGVGFYLFGTSFLIINSHLTPHENKLNDRIRDYHTIMKSLNFPKTTLNNDTRGNLLKPSESPTLTERPSSNVPKEAIFDKFDYVIWMGDLNFRLKLQFDQIKRLLKRITNRSLFSPSNSVNASEHQNGHIVDGESTMEESLKILVDHDQLNISQRQNSCFGELDESPISFLPTYKFDLFSDDYDSSGKKRCPAFTDRIMFCGKKKNRLNCLLYDSCMSINTSDHKPIIGVFVASIENIGDELRDKIWLGSGYFDHDVYSKAMNRNREKMRRNSRLSLHSSNSIPLSVGSNTVLSRNHSMSSASSATSNVCSIQ